MLDEIPNEKNQFFDGFPVFKKDLRKENAVYWSFCAQFL